MLVIALSNVHIQAQILECSGKTDWKVGGLVSINLEHCSCLINVTDSLGSGSKEVMGTILQQYMIRMVLTFCYHSPKWCDSQSSVPVPKGSF